MIYLKRQDVIQAILDARNKNVKTIRKRGEEYESGFMDAVMLMLGEIHNLEKHKLNK